MTLHMVRTQCGVTGAEGQGEAEIMTETVSWPLAIPVGSPMRAPGCR